MTEGPGRQRTGNRLLDELPQAVFQLIEDDLVPLAFPAAQALIESGEPVGTVYFPTRGMASIVRRLKDGSAVEVAVVGSDGMVGVAILLGDDRENTESMVQIAGAGLSLKADVLRTALALSPALRSGLLRYVPVLMAQMAQSSACNARHGTTQRLARWILAASARIGDNHVSVSHDFIAMMLGIRRAGVTVALAKLRADGLISNGRNRIAILDRTGLEAVSCECFRDAETERDRILPARV